jgi:hypothetical protein
MRLLLCLLVGILQVAPLAAQDFPNRPIHFIAPFGPGHGDRHGGAGDRRPKLTRLTGQAAWSTTSRAPRARSARRPRPRRRPDGYTIFVTTQTTQSINQHVYKKLMYDPVKSFEPISGLSGGAQMVVVRNDLPVKTIPEFIALAKAQPGKLTFGSGNGSARGRRELFRIMAKVDLLGVPYKTQPQVIADLLGGRIDVTFSDFTVGLPPVRDGRARGLGVTSPQRWPGWSSIRPSPSSCPATPRSLERGLCAGRHAAADHRQAEQVDPRGRRLGGLSQPAQDHARRAVPVLARGTGGVPGEGDDQVGRDRPRRGDEGALGAR